MIPRLYLCEKPSQATDLARVLGCSSREDGSFTNPSSGEVVTFAVGHLLQPADPEAYGEHYAGRWRLDVLPILPETWQLVSDPKTVKQLNVVKRLLRKAKEVVIATDADREGEVIARNVLDHAGYRGEVKRLWVSDSTTAGIRAALRDLRPGRATEGLFASGVGRQRADWLTGMNFTRALTCGFGRGSLLNFGRVQTPTLALVVRRERAIRSFQPKHYLSVRATFLLGAHPEPVAMRWLPRPDQVDKDGHLVDAALAQALVQRVERQVGVVSDVTTDRKTESAPLLHDLGALQRECANRFGLTADRTLAIAQALYETHKLLTYPRTDCRYISEEMYPAVQDTLAAIRHNAPEWSRFIDRILADPLRPPGRVFNSKKVAESSHHAIIPTRGGNTRIDALKADERRVYELVVGRYVAQFMPDHEFDETRLLLECAGERFTATGRVTVTPGWREIEATGTSDEPRGKRARTDEADEAEETTHLPPVTKGMAARNHAIAIEKKQTQPPKRYTEASLLAAMESIDREIEDPRLAAIMKNKEKAGIGTPATRGEILKKLFNGEYLAREKKSIVPTERGTALIDLLERVAPPLVDLALTAVWESALSEVEAGRLPLPDFERRINAFVTQLIERMRQQANESSQKEPGTHVPNTSQPSERTGRSRAQAPGSSLPRGSTRDTRAESATRTSPTRTSPTDKPKIGESCPTCKQGRLTQRATKEGRPFIGCTRYPECRFFAWIPH